MKKNRLLSIEDLYNYYSSKSKSVHFSSKDDNHNIVVQTRGNLYFEQDYDKNTEGLLPVTLEACHINENLNRSEISEKVMTAAMPSFSNRPILGFIHEVDGEPQFFTHNMHINDNNEIEYDEIPIGTVRENCNPRYIEKDNKKYCVVDGYIYENYTKAADIIRREQRCDVSVELEIRELSFNSKNKTLVIEDFFFSGVTILGVDEEGNKVMPGMEGSNITIADFSRENNSIFSNNKQVIELLSALNEKIDNLDIKQKSLKEGGLNSVKKDFDENSEVAEAEVEVTPSATTNENVTFDGEEPGEEPGGEEPAEEPSEEPGNDDPTDPPADDPTDPPADDDDDDDDEGDDEGGDDDDDEEDEGIPLGQRDDDDTAGETKKKTNSIDYTVNVNGIEKDFSVTLREKLLSLSVLINETYGDADGTWYDIDADEDKKIVYFHDFWNDKHYRQLYSIKKDIYSLKGDRTELFAKYLSREEIEQFENLKSEYELINSELNNYHSEPDKLELLNDECYSQIVETDGYKELAKRETYFSMSVDEVREELDRQLLEFAKHNKVEFSAKEEKNDVGVKVFKNPADNTPAGKGRYGGIFKR